MSCLLQYRYFLLEFDDLLSGGIGHEEAFDGHFPMPVPLVDLTHSPTSYALAQLDLVVGDTPLVYNTVSMLLGERGGGEMDGKKGGEGREI